MTSPMVSNHLRVQQATDLWSQGHYHQAALLYEQLLESTPTEKQYAWYLGLAYLLQGEEAEAQMVWTLAMAEAEAAEAATWTANLLEILETEAQRQAQHNQCKIAWAIRQYIHQIDPTLINNLLHSLLLAAQVEAFTLEQQLEQLEACQLLSLLESANTTSPAAPIDADLLLETMAVLLEHGNEYAIVFAFTKAAAVLIPDREAAITTILDRATHIGYVQRNYLLAARYGEICLDLNSNHARTLLILSSLYIFISRYEESIQLAKRYYRLCQSLAERADGSAAVFRALTRAGGSWGEAQDWLVLHKQIAIEWLDAYESGNYQEGKISSLFPSFFYLPYFEDDAAGIRHLLNRVGRLSQDSLQTSFKQVQGKAASEPLFPPRPVVHQPRPLRIAYLSCFLRRHSIGWLARWLLHHHNKDQFEIQVYFAKQSEVCAFGKQWYADKASKAACVYGDLMMIAETIYENEVDILVDLDSITSEESCTVLSLKPAPIQVTWLGWDAAGIPAVDYYLADPYVLPEQAQDYYSEKIWRLPTTYLAVDGFEVGIPNLRRDRLDIPSDAVIYLSSQTGQKRNLDNIRAQMKIIKAVPNSYFLIKGFSDETMVKASFEQVAEAEGVALDRLRFLPPTPDEETHRANLAIADVVLDTFPYNGATTTMETLWMGIPIVTRVGQQFSARNSYGMMTNAGIEAGIAWDDQQYIEWGVRLGTDAALRQQVAWQLRQSRHTAPLWNAKQFTRDVEQAYEQMWQRYVQQG